MTARLDLDRSVALLAPRPRRFEPQPTSLCIAASGFSIERPAGEGEGSRRIADHLEKLLQRRDVSITSEGAKIRFELDALPFAELDDFDALDDARLAQAYRLRIDEHGVTLHASGEAGLYYGATTLIQWLDIHRANVDGALPKALTGVEIVDYPDFVHRGVMLDISRDKVPTMKTLRELVLRLASWKINQLQLYTEHTFAYIGHDVVWQHASPMTPQEVQQLDALCRAHHIELVPNQNSFGHLHRWLIHEPYRQLAECPAGISHPFSDDVEPYGLCPTDPDSFALLEELYDQLLPNFQSRQFNVGLDETLDLGLGRSAKHCEARGRGEVFFEFLSELHRRLGERGVRMQCWGDIIQQHEALVPRMPRDLIVLEWGYEANHPFEQNLARLVDAKLDCFYVCPGTSSWNSLGGRANNALRNLASAARAGKAAGAAGYLITDWGDNGHLQPLPVSYLGLLAGASFAWNSAAIAEDAATFDIASALDLYVFEDDSGAAGRALVDLAQAYSDAAGDRCVNGSALFWLLNKADRPLSERRFGGVTTQGLEKARARIVAARDALKRARMSAADAPLIEAELRWVADALELACDIGIARLADGLPDGLATAALPTAKRREFEARLSPLIETHQTLWLGRNRPGGLMDSARRLHRLRELLAQAQG